MDARARAKWLAQAGGMRVRATLVASDACVIEPPLLLVPGLGVSHRYLMPFAERIAAERCCYALDLPGFGTWHKPDRPLSAADYAELVAAWMDEMGLARAALLGNSLGCEVIAHLAALHSERVAGLVLTSPSMDPAGRTLPRTLARWALDIPREPPSLMPLVARDWLATGPLWMARGLTAMLRDPIETVLPHVTAPALVVRGERDAIVPRRWAEEAAELLPYGRLAEISGAVHAVTFDAPEALVALVRVFLAEDLQPAACVSRETA
jgi:pimeloyl-ACP methyl ester carboxylesterase